MQYLYQKQRAAGAVFHGYQSLKTRGLCYQIPLMAYVWNSAGLGLVFVLFL